MSRPCKTIRLNFWKRDPAFSASIQVLAQPAEVKLSASDKAFVSIRENGISLSPGLGKNINIQGLPQNLKYGGMLSDLPFPLSIMPTTPFTPYPKQIFSPPLAKIMPFLADMNSIASSLVL
jgi:hypothetical protein